MTELYFSGLIASQDRILHYERTATEELEVTPVTAKTWEDGRDLQKIPVAGIIPLAATLGAGPATWSYKTINVSAALTTDKVLSLSAADYALFEVGVFYKNVTSGELLYCLEKVTDNSTYYTVTFARGLDQTTPAAIATADDIAVLNTVVFDSQTGSTYDAGHGDLIFKEIPVNLASGQKLYPMADYNARL